MATLQEQIRPQMTMVPAEDQTFRQYVEELLRTSKGFTGPFAASQQKQQQPTPTTNVTQGLFSKFLPESSGGNGGGLSAPGTGISSVGQGISPATQSLGFALTANPGVVGQIGSLFGVPSVLGRALSQAVGEGMLNSQIDAISNSFGALSDIGNMGLGGVVSMSDPAGNVVSFSSPKTIAAYDLATFGSGGGYDGGGFGGATDSGDGTGGGFGVGSVGASGEGEASDGLGP